VWHDFPEAGAYHNYAPASFLPGASDELEELPEKPSGTPRARSVAQKQSRGPRIPFRVTLVLYRSGPGASLHLRASPLGFTFGHRPGATLDRRRAREAVVLRLHGFQAIAFLRQRPRLSGYRMGLDPYYLYIISGLQCYTKS